MVMLEVTRAADCHMSGPYKPQPAMYVHLARVDGSTRLGPEYYACQSDRLRLQANMHATRALQAACHQRAFSWMHGHAYYQPSQLEP